MPPTSDSAVKQAIAWFHHCHIETIGSPYLMSYGKDQAIMKQIVGIYGVNKSLLLIGQFFKEVSTDIFLQQTGASVGIFKSQLPKLLLKINKNEKMEQTGKL